MKDYLAYVMDWIYKNLIGHYVIIKFYQRLISDWKRRIYWTAFVVHKLSKMRIAFTVVLL